MFSQLIIHQNHHLEDKFTGEFDMPYSTLEDFTCPIYISEFSLLRSDSKAKNKTRDKGYLQPVVIFTKAKKKRNTSSHVFSHAKRNSDCKMFISYQAKIDSSCRDKRKRGEKQTQVKAVIICSANQRV